MTWEPNTFYRLRLRCTLCVCSSNA